MTEPYRTLSNQKDQNLLPGWRLRSLTEEEIRQVRNEQYRAHDRKRWPTPEERLLDETETGRAQDEPHLTGLVVVIGLAVLFWIALRLFGIRP